MALPFEPTSVRTAPNGVIALWKQPPVAYSRVKGHLSKEHAGYLIKNVDATIAASSVLVEQFHDWGEMQSYDMAAQMDLTLWTVRVRKNIKSLTILTKHPVVTMGVRVANTTLKGMIHVCENYEEFERRLSERLKTAA